MRLENGTRPEEIAPARAEVASAQADTDFAGQRLGRLMEIEENSGGAVCEQDLDNARSRHRVAVAQLENRKKGTATGAERASQGRYCTGGGTVDVFRAELALLRHQFDLAELKSLLIPLYAHVCSNRETWRRHSAPFMRAIIDQKWVRA